MEYTTEIDDKNARIARIHSTLRQINDLMTQLKEKDATTGKQATTQSAPTTPTAVRKKHLHLVKGE